MIRLHMIHVGVMQKDQDSFPNDNDIECLSTVAVTMNSILEKHFVLYVMQEECKKRIKLLLER